MVCVQRSNPLALNKAGCYKLSCSSSLFDALLVVFNRGSRVENYTPLQELLVKLAQQHGALELISIESVAGSVGRSEERSGEDEPFLHIQLPDQVSELLYVACLYHKVFERQPNTVSGYPMLSPIRQTGYNEETSYLSL
jgi:hypothetical protein